LTLKGNTYNPNIQYLLAGSEFLSSYYFKIICNSTHTNSKAQIKRDCW